MKEEYLELLFNDEEYILAREVEQKEYESMAYYKDINRVEDALIPSLFQYLIAMHIRDSPEKEKDYEVAMGILEKRIEDAFKGGDRKKLTMRTARIARKITEYFIQNKFDSRKGFLTLTSWIKALDDAGGIVVEGDFKELMLDMEAIIQRGYEEIENFEKIDLSAINHVEKIHKLAQEEGYF
jgi:hypothetical protein